jgi:TonB family protein
MRKPRRFPMRFPLLFVIASLSLIPSVAQPADLEKDFKHAAEHLASEMQRLALHSIYVQDFLDPNGERRPTGVFFAATFSQALSKHARKFSAISRADAHKFLDQSGWTDNDLSTSDVFAKFTSEFHPDAILHGSVSLRDGKYYFEFTAQDLTGKELFRFPYQVGANFTNMAWLYLPPTHNPSGRIFYFAGLDGVSLPKMIFAPNPSYSPKARQDRVSGVVVLSAIVTLDGRPDQISVLRKLHPDLDANSVATLKTWRLIPCETPDGTPIPVRVDFEVSFRLY